MRFYPFMNERGFTLDLRQAPHFIGFRRLAEGRIQFFEIQWDKYGRPRFTANYGSVSARGAICHGQPISAGDVGPGQATQYCRIYPHGKGTSTRHWFRQDRPLISVLLTWKRLYPPQQPVEQLMALFTEAETYWATGNIGHHSRKIRNNWVTDLD